MFGILAGASIISSALGYDQSRKARKKSKSAERLAASRSAIINVQNRRAAAASIRRQQAMQASLAIASGMQGGSADKATASSLQSQGLASMAQQAHQIELGAGVNEQIAAANRYSNRAGDYNALGQLFGQVGSFADAIQKPATPSVPGLPVKPT